MDLTALAAAGDRNLAETWARIGGTSGWEVDDDDLTVLASSGLPIAFFNGAYVRRPVPFGESDAVVARTVGFFGARGVPWLLWMRVDTDPELSGACERARLREVGGPPAMVLPAIPLAPPVPAGLDIVRATADDLDSLRSVLREGYGLLLDVAEMVSGASLIDADGFVVLLGLLDGARVTTAAVSVTGTSAGVYSVATVPSARGKGLGAAVTWAAVMAGREMGADHATLQSSESGYPVYRRMGFVDVGRYEQWEGPPG